jgi:hypothetical protein
MKEKCDYKKCEICGEVTQYTDYSKFSQHHLKPIHNINFQSYYDRFYKTLNEGMCITCGKSTSFLKSKNKGYARFCSSVCALKDPDLKCQATKKRISKEIETYGMPFISTPLYVQKTKRTKKRKYGDEKWCNPDKIKSTCIERYGVSNFSKTQKFRADMETRGLFVPLQEQTEFNKYRLKVLSETRKYKKELLDHWDGLDYNTKEVLETDPKKFNHKMYRTIDHKISMFAGFAQNIPPEIIGHIDNLCIISRKSNSRKGHR